jgi:hypothetical protein
MQVEKLKILLRLMPIWVMSIVMSGVYAHLNTTLVQGGATDMWVVSFTILAVSLLFLEVLCILAWVHIYGSVILLALRAISRPTGDRGDAQEWPTVLQRNFWP